MSDPIDFESLDFKYIDEIDPEVYKDFSCDRPELNEFLVEDALYHHKQNLTNTTLVLMNDKVIGFFSLSSDAIQLSPSEKGYLALNGRFEISVFPAVKITKLAVSSEQMSRGLGKLFLEIIEGSIYNLPFAVRFLTVDAVSIKVEFYERNGFVVSLYRDRQIRQSLNGVAPNNVLMHKDLYSE